MVNHSDDNSGETDTYTDTGPENKYHVLELSISNMTRYFLINFTRYTECIQSVYANVINATSPLQLIII